MSRMKKQWATSSAAFFLASSLSFSTFAYTVYEDSQTQVNADVSAVFGVFHSQKAYQQSGEQKEGSKSWREGYVKYGLSAKHQLPQAAELSGAVAWVSSASWGDNDAAGFTNGSERRTKLEEAWFKWQSGQWLHVLGENGLEISVGKQFVSIGDGFLVHGDAVSLGNGIADGDLNRGGAYYIAGRSSFDKTAVVRLGGEQGLRSDLMWLKSDNPVQAKMGLYAATFEYVDEANLLGLSAIKGHSIDRKSAEIMGLEHRKNMQVYSVRGKTNAGIEPLSLSAEYAWQKNKSIANENAWYVEAGWAFNEVAWTPTVNYRYSRFSSGYDPLFYGFSRGFGTWYQGEVAANYSGPLSTNTKVHHVGMMLTPKENIALGALLFDFKTLDAKQVNTTGREIDLYLNWDVNEHLSITPLVGWYKPKKSFADGGVQLGDAKRNLYSQLLITTQF